MGIHFLRVRSLQPFWLFIVLISWAIAPIALAIDDPALTRFRQDAPPAWTQLIDMVSCIEGEASAVKSDALKGEIVLKEGPWPFRSNGLHAYRPMSSEKNERIRIICQNLEYEFIVDKAKGGNWNVAQVVWKDRTTQQFSTQPYWDDDGTVGRLPFQQVLAYACRGLIVNTTWLPHLVASPSFEVVDITTISEQGKRGLVRLQFRNNVKRVDAVTFENGELVLDPARFWQIVEGRINAHYGAAGTKQMDLVYVIINKFELANGKIPYVSSQRLRTVSLPTLDQEDYYKTKIAIADKSDLRPFRLTAFGLPEPAPGGDAATSRYSILGRHKVPAHGRR